ncbi:MAG: spore maturation protein [Oscillospiraceae bacterium]|nr:spore maturation protein [Oscillospiraceae bacterium]
MSSVTVYIIPCAICAIVVYGMCKKVDVFNVFIEGAKDGISTSINIMPALIVLLTAVGMFKASGALDIIVNALKPLSDMTGIPKEVFPLALLRPISGSGSLAIYENILTEHGADSFIGRVASVIQGSTETTFYVIAVYFGSLKITKTRFTIPCALASDAAGFILSALAVRLLMP